MAEEVNKKKPDYQISEDEFKEGAQRFHDYYVNLAKQGPLDEADKLNLDIALKQEKEGLVKPLEEKVEQE